MGIADKRRRTERRARTRRSFFILVLLLTTCSISRKHSTDSLRLSDLPARCCVKLTQDQRAPMPLMKFILSLSLSLSLLATHAMNFNTLIKMFGFKQFYFCFYANAILCSRGRRSKRREGGRGVVGRRFFMLLWNLLYFSPLIVHKADKKQRHKEQ